MFVDEELVETDNGQVHRRWPGFRHNPVIFFHDVTSEYDSTFVFLKLWLQLRILEMTEIHQRRNMYSFALIPCFRDHLIFVSDFRQLLCLLGISWLEA